MHLAKARKRSTDLSLLICVCASACAMASAAPLADDIERRLEPAILGVGNEQIPLRAISETLAARQ